MTSLSLFNGRIVDQIVDASQRLDHQFRLSHVSLINIVKLAQGLKVLPVKLMEPIR